MFYWGARCFRKNSGIEGENFPLEKKCETILRDLEKIAKERGHIRDTPNENREMVESAFLR